MKAEIRITIVKTLMVACTALLYGPLLVFSQLLGPVRMSKAICDMFPLSVRGWPLFWCITFGLEIPVFFVCGLVAAFFMAFVFRSTSWCFGLLAALIAVALLHYVLEFYLPFLIALEVLPLPVACALLDRFRRRSIRSSQPLAPSPRIQPS